MKVSITKAANLAGVSRTTLYNDMNSGKITYVTSGKNKKVIDVSELERVYGSLNVNTSKDMPTSKTSEQNFTKKEKESDATLIELAVLREKLEIFETERKREREQLSERIEQLQETLNKTQENQNKTTLLLEHYTKEGVGGDWQKSIKALEERIANQEKAAQKKAKTLDKEKEELKTQLEKKEKILKEQQEALKLEKNKSFFHKLFGS